MKHSGLRRFAEVNKEWWLVLSMFVIAAILDSMATRNQMMLCLYVLPTMFSAYFFGRRHAMHTAFASIFLVVLGWTLESLLFHGNTTELLQHNWYDLIVWGTVLVALAYSMGTLFRELREMYEGMLLILGHLVSRDTGAQQRARRLAWLATMIGREAGISMERLVDMQSAALLQEIGTMEISGEVLAKAGRLTASERNVLPDGESKKARAQRDGLHSLERVIPIMLGANNEADYYAASKGSASLESRILAIANEYNNLISDAENRSALSPHVARSIILRAAGTRYSFDVVNAFVAAFDSGSLNWVRQDLPQANDTAYERYESKFGKPGAEEDNNIRRTLTLA
jgi:hypothetical protein